MLSGLLWAAAWPGIGGMAPLAFVAWLPLLHAERVHDTLGGKRSFVPWVLLAHFVWNASCSWWFFLVSEPLPTRIVSVTAPVVVNTWLMTMPWWLKRVTARIISQRVAVPAFMVLWLAMERLHHGWDLQWPWFSLGNVFGFWPAWVQWYEVTGMLGGSLWVLMVTFLLDAALRNRMTGVPFKRHAIAALLVVLLPLSSSLVRFHTYEERGAELEVVVVQPNVDPYLEKFGGVDALTQLEQMLAQADAAMGPGTQLVILPETALQERSYADLSAGPDGMHGLWENDLGRSASVQRMRAFQADHPGVAMLAGMSSYYLVPEGAPKPPAARPLGENTGRWYQASNAAVFLAADGTVGHYRKSKLVAGVEAMPFESVLGRLDDLALDLGGTTGSLAQQEERAVFRDSSAGFSAIPVICYESVFGEHVAAHVRNGGDLITVITNDGWWGRSPGYRQHLAFSGLRAIEARRAVARSANTGISCFVDQRGVMTDLTAWWEPDARRTSVRLNRTWTPFVKFGDVTGRVAVLLATVLLTALLLRAARMRYRNRGTRRAMGPSGPSKRTT